MGPDFDSEELAETIKKYPLPPYTKEERMKYIVEPGIKMGIMKWFCKKYPTPELRKENYPEYQAKLKQFGAKEAN
jgi:hypothetical protein